MIVFMRAWNILGNSFGGCRLVSACDLASASSKKKACNTGRHAVSLSVNRHFCRWSVPLFPLCSSSSPHFVESIRHKSEDERVRRVSRSWHLSRSVKSVWVARFLIRNFNSHCLLCTRTLKTLIRGPKC